jgi:TolB protein
VAFTAQLSAENQEIFLYNFETQALRQLTRLGARVADGAAWSPDGTQLAFSANPLGRGDGEQINFDLYLYTLADGEVFNLTDGRGSSREPHWSPDGARLVFSSDRATPGELEIFVMALDDLGTAQQLTSATGRSFSPKFSPDGTRIAFISNRGGDNDLYLMMADGTDERLVTVNDGGADDRDPTWSPDGSWLVLSSNRDNSEVLQLWAVSPDGSGWQVLTSGLGSSRYAEFFPE